MGTVLSYKDTINVGVRQASFFSLFQVNIPTNQHA